MADYARVTLTDIQGFLTERVGNNTVFWPTAQLTDAINHAIRVWQALTGEWSIHSSTVTCTGAHFYDEHITGQDWAFFRITHSLDGRVLQMLSLEDLDLGFPGWDSSSTTGDPLYWAPLGSTRFAVHPAPTTGTFTLESYQSPPALVAGGDFIQIGDEELQKLIAYAHHYLTFKEGIAEMEATKGALEDLIEAAARRNAFIRFTNFYRSVGKGQKLHLAPTETLGMRGGG